MQRRFIGFSQVLLGGLDIITLNLMVIFTSLIFGANIPNLGAKEPMQFWIIMNVGWILVCWIGNVYTEKYIIAFESFSRRSMGAFLYWVGIIILYLFFFRKFELSRLFIVACIGTFGIALVANRFIYLVLYHYFHKHNYLSKKVLIVGYNDVSKKLVSYFESEGINKKIVGYCEEENKVEELSHYPILSPIDVISTSKMYNVNEIFCTVSPEEDGKIYKLMQDADQQCIRFWLIPDPAYFIKWPVHIDYYKDIPLLSLRTEPLDDVSSRIKKRLLDILISFLSIIFILSWLIPLLSILIWLESRGPVFFIQARSGRNNKSFNCIKFRSMEMNADPPEKQATGNNSRLTKVGKFLRKYNLDEFPQFINVLSGSMSVVGPRPHVVKQTEDYSKLISKYMVRKFLKPGITGWAQVNGLRGEAKALNQMQRRVEHDIWYLGNWSMWLDIRIIFLAIYSTLRGDESAF